MAPETVLEQYPNHELSKAYRALEKKNKDLIDGLYYASFVQQGLMPQARHFQKLNNPYFVYYNPLHIIGGDFFWIGKKGDWNLYAVGDCTGHGVSGAMLSTLAIGFLNYLVYSKEYSTVSEILLELDKKWMETFRRDEEAVNNDWLELTLVAFNTRTREFQFTGAKRNAFVVSEHQGLLSLAGDAYPIGGWQIEENRRFSTRHFIFDHSFKVYLFSDGMQDQFGGFKNKRFGSRNLQEFIRGLAALPMAGQKAEVERQFDLWKGGNEQTDDVCLLGVEF